MEIFTDGERAAHGEYLGKIDKAWKKEFGEDLIFSMWDDDRTRALVGSVGPKVFRVYGPHLMGYQGMERELKTKMLAYVDYMLKMRFKLRRARSKRRSRPFPRCRAV